MPRHPRAPSRRGPSEGWRDHGIAVGSRADLVVLEAPSLAEAVGALPPRRFVGKAGRVTVDAPAA